MISLSYIPFIEPLSALQSSWYLMLIPLAFGISVIYKALRVKHFRGYWRQVALMTTQIVVAMLALAIGLAVFILLVIPLLPVS